MAVNPRGGDGGLPDGTFEVENIIGQRSNNGKKEYLFKWKGYAETTWEPERSVTLQIAALQFPKLITRLKQGFMDSSSNETKKRKRGRKRKQTRETELQVPPNPAKKLKRMSYKKKEIKMESDPLIETKDNIEPQTLPHKSESYKKSNKNSDPLTEIEKDEVEIETTSKKGLHSGRLETEMIESADITYYGSLEYFMKKNENVIEIKTSKKGFLCGPESEMSLSHEHEHLNNKKRSLKPDDLENGYQLL